MPKRASTQLGQISGLKKVYTKSYLTCFFPSWKTSSCIDWAVDWRPFDDKARLLRDFTASFPSVPLCRSASKQNWWVQVTRTWWLKRTAKMNDTFRSSGHKQAGWSSWERQGVYRAVSGKKNKHKKLPHSIQYGIQRIVIHSNYSPLSDHQKFEDFRSGCQLIRIKQHRVLFREQVSSYFSKF